MNEVKVNKQQLLDIVRLNRSQHSKIFLEAQEGYRAQAIAELDRMIADAKGGRKIRRSVTLIEPVDQTREYDRAIRMLEMSVDELVTLDERTFQCLVQNEWDWMKQFRTANYAYSKTLQDLSPDSL